MLNGEGFSAADLAAVVGNNNDGFGGNNNGAWWLLILLLFANNGWGNGFGNNGCASGGYATQEQLQTGLDQMAVMNSLNGLTSAVTTGFGNAEISRANTLASITNQMNTIAMNQQQCCCDNRLAVANLGAQIASEACADRQSVNDGVRDIMAMNTANTNALLNTINGGIQSIQDKLCQQEIEALKTQNANLQTQLNLANLKGSQDAQTAAILANNEAQTAALERYLAPSPIPAYVVPQPFGCNCGNNYGCGCGN